MTFLGLISPQGSVKYLCLSQLLCLSWWVYERLTVFSGTHTRIYTHIRRVYVGLWDETLFICARPLLFCFSWHKPSPFPTLYLYLSLSHTLLILFLCSLTRGTVLNYPCCTVKCTGSFSQNLPLNHCSDNLLYPQVKSGYIFGSLLKSMFWTDLNVFFLISHCIFSNDVIFVLVSFKIIMC